MRRKDICSKPETSIASAKPIINYEVLSGGAFHFQLEKCLPNRIKSCSESTTGPSKSTFWVLLIALLLG